MNNTKFKLSTYNKSEKVYKIIEVIRKHPEGIAPKDISLYTGINHSTIRTLLRNIGPDISRKGKPGLYYFVGKEGYSALFDYTIQNARLNYNLNELPKEHIREEIGDKEIVKITFEIGVTNKKANMIISTDNPSPVTAIFGYLETFKLLIEKYTPEKVNIEDFELSTIEFQKDFSKVRIDGANSISIKNLLSEFKLYNKKDGLRLEHKIIQPISAPTILALLSQNLKNVDMLNEMEFLKREIKRISKNQRTTNKLLKNKLFYDY